MNDVSRNKKWNSILRIGGLAISLGGLYISAQFSVDGFAFSVDDRKWVGWAMAIIIIVLESIWQKFGSNRTLFSIAMICYVYGVFTNVVGMMANRTAEGWKEWVIPVVFGVLLEVFPEPVLAWAISGDTTSDPVGKLIDGIEGKSVKPAVPQSTRPAMSYRPQQVKPKFQHKGEEPSFRKFFKDEEE